MNGDILHFFHFWSCSYRVLPRRLKKMLIIIRLLIRTLLVKLW